MQYIKIPKEIIYAKDISDKRVLCFSYFVFHSCLNGRSFYTIPYLVTWCEYSPKRGTGKINEKFINVLSWLYSNGLIQNYDNSDYFSISDKKTYIVDCNKNWIFPDKEYGIIFDFEIESIKKYYKNNKSSIDRRVSHSTIILVLAYIRKNIRSRPKESYDVKKEIEKCPEVFYQMYKNMVDDIGLNSKLCAKCIDILCTLNILVKESMPRFKDEDGNFHTDSTIFANKYKYIQDKKTGQPILDTNYKWEREVKAGKKLVASRTFKSNKNYKDMEDFN